MLKGRLSSRCKESISENSPRTEDLREFRRKKPCGRGGSGIFAPDKVGSMPPFRSRRVLESKNQTPKKGKLLGWKGKAISAEIRKVQYGGAAFVVGLKMSSGKKGTQKKKNEKGLFEGETSPL